MTTKRSFQTDLVRVLLAMTAALAALAAAPEARAGGPVEGAAPGCTLQCIEKALVTTSASSAKVEIATAVRTRVAATARRLSSSGRIDGPAIKVAGRYLLKSHTLRFRGLQPERTYHITVTATDAAGRTASRSGRFETRQVQTSGQSGADGLSAGLGCSAKCITKAVPVHIGPTAALFEVATNTAARITVITSRAGTGSIVSIATSPFTRSYRHAASPLDPGTRYDLRVRATDAEGRTEHHHFSFTTVERKATVTFWKVQIIDDGDWGPDRGELTFSYWLGGKHVQSDALTRRSSGDVFDVRASGTSRPGLSGVLAANGAAPKLDIRVHADECDAVLLKNCVGEVWDAPGPSGGGAGYAVAGGLFALNAFLSGNALPASYGTMLPSGHQAYLVFETTQYGVKFRVFATVDYSFG